MGFQDIAIKALQGVSGNSAVRNNKYFIYNRIIGFKGVTEGVGCSTIVATVALELAKKGLNVCVVDTSILAPTQYLLLNVETEEDEDSKDWFDLSLMKDTGNILKISKFANNIAVLGFENRNINNLLSTFDTEELVTSAFGILEDLYDIVLVDICNETTNITTAAAIHSHAVFQVWTDEFKVLSHIDSFVRNMTYMCCSVDKMRNVIINKNIINSDGDWNTLLKKYNFNCLGKAPFSLEFYAKQCSGTPLYKVSSSDKTIVKVAECINKVVEYILGVNFERGNIRAKDIMDGKVDGTLRKEYRERQEEIDKVLAKDKAVIESMYFDKETTHITGKEEEPQIEVKKKGFFRRK